MGCGEVEGLMGLLSSGLVLKLALQLKNLVGGAVKDAREQLEAWGKLIRAAKIQPE